MPRQRKQPVEKDCENCGVIFKTRYPRRARYCSSRCRSEVWDREHRVEDKEAFAREAVQAYWRRTKAEWRKRKREAQPG